MIDEEFRITLPFCPSSNGAYPTNKRTGKRFKSKRFIEWLLICPKLRKYPKYEQCRIEYLIFFPDNRIRDGQSYMKLPLDYLVSEKVIDDDNRKIVKGESWTDCGNDKLNPRIEIIIKKL